MYPSAQWLYTPMLPSPQHPLVDHVMCEMNGPGALQWP